jgi:hypothetical protein
MKNPEPRPDLLEDMTEVRQEHQEEKENGLVFHL